MIIGALSKKSQLLNAILFFVFSFVIVSFLFLEDYKYKMNELLITTSSYKHLIRIKAIKAIGIVLTIYLIIYGSELLWIINKVGLHGLNYSIYSLMEFQNMMVNLSILEYLLLVNCIRLFMVSCMLVVIVCVGRKAKNTLVVLIGAFLIIILPLILAYLGITGFDQFICIRWMIGYLMPK